VLKIKEEHDKCEALRNGLNKFEKEILQYKREEVDMPALQTVHAIYKDEKLIFTDRSTLPENGVEVIITFINKSKPAPVLATDPIRDLRGRGRGENLVHRLLKSRSEDRERG